MASDSRAPARYKNAICASMGLLILFVTSFFVCEDYFNAKITQLIDGATLLKDSQYPSWGQLLNSTSATYTHKFDLFDYDDTSLREFKLGTEKLTLSTAVRPNSQPQNTIEFDLDFRYCNLSFSQGSTGSLRFLNQWTRRAKNTDNFNNTIRTINVAAEKIFGYDYTATQSRRFVLMQNVMTETLKGPFIAKFYAEYLFLYYFQQEKQVIRNILTPVIGSIQLSQRLYRDEEIGWYTPALLAKWLQMSWAAVPAFEPAYERARLSFSLSSKQMKQLIGSSSMLSSLVLAVNSTLKNKVQGKEIANKDNCNPLCSNEQLAAFQLSNGLLTQQTIMAGFSLGVDSSTFNGSWLGPIQYQRFCSDHSEYTCLNSKIVYPFFLKGMLNNFRVISEAFKNIGKSNVIQHIFDLEQLDGQTFYGESVINYILYLNSTVYNIPQQFQAYQQVWTYYRYFAKTMLQFKDILFFELYLRSFRDAFGNTNCSQYFVGKFQNFSNLCNEYNPVSSENVTRLYVQAYFLTRRAEFVNKTKMNFQTALTFFKMPELSLFAQQMVQIQSDNKIWFNCQLPVCSPEELAARQWGGDRPILDNLPPKYFNQTQNDIRDWDHQNLLNKIEPQYRKVMNKTKSQKQSRQLLDKETGLGQLYNLMQLHSKAQTDTDAKQLLNYVRNIVIEIAMGGVFESRTIQQLIQGFNSTAIQVNRQMNPNVGGTPWMKSSIALIETKHQTSKFNIINTGIYDAHKVRTISSFEGNSDYGSDYIVFQSEGQNVVEVQLTSRIVNGTDLLGFHSNINQGDELSVHLDFAFSSLTLVRSSESDTSLSQDEIPFYTLRFNIKDAGTSFDIGINEQNQRSITIYPQSYVVVEPITGLTVAMNIRYGLTAHPFYLQQTSIPIYEGTVSYKRHDLQRIIDIHNTKDQLQTFYMTTVILSALSMTLVLLSVFLYCRKQKNTKKESLIDSLMREQNQIKADQSSQ